MNEKQLCLPKYRKQQYQQLINISANKQCEINLQSENKTNKDESLTSSTLTKTLFAQYLLPETVSTCNLRCDNLCNKKLTSSKVLNRTTSAADTTTFTIVLSTDVEKNKTEKLPRRSRHRQPEHLPFIHDPHATLTDDEMDFLINTLINHNNTDYDSGCEI